MDDFWSHFRIGQKYQRSRPTSLQYHNALGNALRDAGILGPDADMIAEAARQERIRAGINDNDLIPRALNPRSGEEVPQHTVGLTNSGNTRNSVCP